MRIGKSEILERDGNISVQFTVDFPEAAETLWYTVDEKYADLVSDRTDAAIVALLIPAMARGEDIHVEGAISERLYYNLAGPYQRVLQCVIPSLRLVGIHPEELRPNDERAPGVATGFSAGIDSYCVLADHHYSAVAPGFRVTHLLYNNVGSHGRGEERLFNERFARAKPVADRIGLPFVAINSNVNAFYKELPFRQTHTPRNVSVALLLQAGIGRYMYASTFSYGQVFIGPSHDMAYSDSVSLPLLATEGVDVFSAGGEYTRVEKTLRVADIEDTYRTLDVCVQGEKAGNCSTCWKCMRTLFTLEIAGFLDRYKHSFDLQAYRSHRERYIAEVLKSPHEPLLREIVSFAKQRGFKFPLTARWYGLLHPLERVKHMYWSMHRRGGGRAKIAL